MLLLVIVLELETILMPAAALHDFFSVEFVVVNPSIVISSALRLNALSEPQASTIQLSEPFSDLIIKCLSTSTFS